MNTIKVKPCQYKSNRLPLQATQRDLKAKKKTTTNSQVSSVAAKMKVFAAAVLFLALVAYTKAVAVSWMP